MKTISVDKISKELTELAAQWIQHYSGHKTPKNFFPLLHSLCAFLYESRAPEDAVRLAQSTEAMGIDRFPGMRTENARHQALALLQASAVQDAEDIIVYYARRLYLIEDFTIMTFFLFMQAQKDIRDEDVCNFAHNLALLFDAKSTAIVDLYLYAEKRQILKQMLAGIPLGKRLLMHLFMCCKRRGRGVIWRLFAYGIQIFFRGKKILEHIWGVDARSILQPGVKKEGNLPIYVARAMGGIGDLMMMTPGLIALARRHPERKIIFAIPRTYHSLFANTPYFSLADVAAEPITRADCYRFYNLTMCPASFVESASRPYVTESRIDIFCKAMHISPQSLSPAEKIPWYRVEPEEIEWAKSWLAQHGIEPGRFIAAQPHSADSYKDYPQFESLVRVLAEKKTVLIFHGEPVSGYDFANTFKVTDCTLRQSIALLYLSEVLIAVDSAFIHIASAFNKKTFALFGPTDGRIFTKYYPNITVINACKHCDCSPCWRNQRSICYINRNYESYCMTNAPVENILQEIHDGEYKNVY